MGCHRRALRTPGAGACKRRDQRRALCISRLRKRTYRPSKPQKTWRTAWVLLWRSLVRETARLKSYATIHVTNGQPLGWLFLQVNVFNGRSGEIRTHDPLQEKPTQRLAVC